MLPIDQSFQVKRLGLKWQVMILFITLPQENTKYEASIELYIDLRTRSNFPYINRTIREQDTYNHGIYIR